jgi:serine protease
MQLLPLILSHLVTWGGTLAPPPGGEALEPLETVLFLDGGVERVLLRYEAPRADRRTHATYSDPATGRSAPVTVGRETLLVGTPAQIRDAVEGHGLELVATLMPSRGIVLVRSASLLEDGAALAARLASVVRAGALEEAYPDLAFRHRILAIDVPPNDERYPGQYYLEEVNIEGAWVHHSGDPNTLIVVNDNGCDLTHPDLVDKLEPGFDPFEEDDDPSWTEAERGENHGTACAGLVAASTDNGIDIAGACPECHVACARILPADGEPVTVSYDVRTFQFAFMTDADVVSNSWGFVDAIPVPDALADAIMEVQQYGRGGRGAVVTFAAGNDSRLVGDDELLAVPGVLGVGALSNIGALTQYSNSGNAVDVVAVTGSVALDIAGAQGDDPGNVTSTFGGTSSACPVVSGIAGLLVSAAPDLTADEINDLLTGTAKQTRLAEPDSNGHDLEYGYGVVQADAAMERALGLDDDGGEGEGEPDPPTCSHARSSAGAPSMLALLILASLFRRRASLGSSRRA